jgi:dynein heavy chain
MIHTIARFYNTTGTLTRIFSKITDQMIANCIYNISTGENDKSTMWKTDVEDTIRQLEECLKLNNVYQEQHRITKKKLVQIQGGKQFECNEMQIFGKIDLFCRRVVKLIDLFTTINQFQTLSINMLEGMEPLIDRFFEIQSEFRSRNHDLLDYHNNKFDRDYVEFNVHITDLEGRLQHFVNSSFESTASISHSLNLLKRFRAILHRDTLKADLDSKMSIIFQNYGTELEQIQQLYEKQKHDPPISRNLPPVAGNIAWSRHLLNRIEEPMKQFETHQGVMGTKDAKRIIKMYNKVARTLIAFEFLWYKAWIQSIDQANVGLQATLIIRHPDDGKLYVNFDQEILQLIREAKCLDRMGIDIPEGAKIALFQEDKFKRCYAELHWILTEYDSIVADIIPVTAMILVSLLSYWTVLPHECPLPLTLYLILRSLIAPTL